jgi:hypothetical protein
VTSCRGVGHNASLSLKQRPDRKVLRRCVQSRAHAVILDTIGARLGAMLRISLGTVGAELPDICRVNSV